MYLLKKEKKNHIYCLIVRLEIQDPLLASLKKAMYLVCPMHITRHDIRCAKFHLLQ